MKAGYSNHSIWCFAFLFLASLNQVPAAIAYSDGYYDDDSEDDENSDYDDEYTEEDEDNESYRSGRNYRNKRRKNSKRFRKKRDSKDSRSSSRYDNDDNAYERIESNASRNSDDMKPEVIAKISQSAIDDAISPDGAKILLGLFFASPKFEASITGGKNKSSEKFDGFGVNAGFEYAKSFKSGLFLAGQVSVAYSPVKKRTGNWSNVNADFEANIDAGTKNNKDKRTAKVNTNSIIPTIGVKAGYVFSSFRTCAYGGLFLSRLAGRYDYRYDGSIFKSVKPSVMGLSFALGAEYRLGAKWGVGFECGIPIQRKIHKKKLVNLEHNVTISRTCMTLFAVFTASRPNPDLEEKFDEYQ